ncbi:MAG: efflux RND transporter permease subunit [Spirochaetales bacterium]|nr:efflux RND transporter permease subunit [Spirochaetales bacterium]
MKRIIEYFYDRRMVTNWILLIVMAAGVFGFTQLRRRVWPQMDYDYITLDVTWAGASALEVEEGLTIPMEESLKGLEGVTRTISTTGDGYLNFWIEADPKIPIDKTVDRVRTAVKSIPSYPADAEAPLVRQLDSWNRVMLLFIYGPEDPDTLQRVADEFRNDLLASGEVTQIENWGMPQKEIRIGVNPDLLREYGLTVDDIAAAVNSSDLNIAAGSVRTGSENLLIRSYGRKTTVQELQSIPLKAGREILSLGQVCSVSEEWPSEVVYTRANGKPAVGFDIMYSNSEDVILISKVVDDLIAESTKKYDGLVTYKPFIRDSDQIEQRLGTLSISGLFGLLLVILILGFFLNLRLSLWVAFGIPFSFLGLFFIEKLMGITINEMSLFGMIMVLGILVDDGIVIGENIFSHWKEQGKDPLKAAVEGTKEVLAPVAVSIVTTMIAFTPYFFIYGEMGQYTSQIGLVIILCLGFSLVEAAVILPVHLAHSRALTSSDGEEAPFRRALDRFQEGLIRDYYAPLLKAALNHRGVSLALTAAFLMVLAGAIMGNHIKAMFFPEVEMPYSYAELSFPTGTSASVINDVRDYVTRTARELGAEEEWNLPNEGYDNGVVDLLSWGGGQSVYVYFIMIPNEERPYPMSEFTSALAERLGTIPQAESVKIGEESAFGGYPISIRFMGEDQEALRRAADRLKEELGAIQGVKDIGDDTPFGARELVFDVNRRGRALGLTPALAAAQIRSGWYGREVARITDGPRQIPVVIRMADGERRSLNQLDRYPLQTPSGEWVLTGDVVDYSVERGLSRIKRENGYRAIRVNAGFDDSKNDLNVVLSEVNKTIVPAILEDIPGVSLSAGGQAEEVQRMMNSMIFAMVAAMVVMFTILMIATGSVGQAGLIMTLIPLGLVGALFGHMIMGLPLSFISFLGVLALGGIIVNDSVVFISTYNHLVRTEGVPPREAALNAGLRRFRAIVMTTLTTSIGLAPLIFQKSVGGQFLVPIAVSVAFGLLFGTFLTLILLPCVLSLMDERRSRNRSENRLVS